MSPKSPKSQVSPKSPKSQMSPPPVPVSKKAGNLNDLNKAPKLPIKPRLLAAALTSPSKARRKQL